MYTPIPANAPLNTNWQQYANNFQYYIGIGPYKGKGLWNNSSAGVNIYSQTPPVWIAPPNAPTVNFQFNNCQHKSWIDPTELNMLSDVPVPSYAFPSTGSDKEMVVYQPSTNTEWDTWETLAPSQSSTKQWEDCWGGKLTGVSTSNGQMPHNYGVAATGLALQNGLITPQDLKAGYIDHVISIATPLTEKGIFSWPAINTDGAYTGPNTMEEGLRFRLDPSINVNTLGLTPLATMIARAAQIYGIVIRNTSTSVEAYAENANTFTSQGQPDPYIPYLGNQPWWNQLTNFPWDNLQALPQNYGQPGTPSF